MSGSISRKAHIEAQKIMLCENPYEGSFGAFVGGAVAGILSVKMSFLHSGIRAGLSSIATSLTNSIVDGAPISEVITNLPQDIVLGIITEKVSHIKKNPNDGKYNTVIDSWSGSQFGVYLRPVVKEVKKQVSKVVKKNNKKVVITPKTAKEFILYDEFRKSKIISPMFEPVRPYQKRYCPVS